VVLLLLHLNEILVAPLPRAPTAARTFQLRSASGGGLRRAQTGRSGTQLNWPRATRVADRLFARLDQKLRPVSQRSARSPDVGPLLCRDWRCVPRFRGRGGGVSLATTSR